METKHTPGPWVVSENGWIELQRGHQVLYVRAGNETVSQCWKTGCDRGLPDEKRKTETEANARLIAAAPELLAALRDLRKEIWSHHKMNVKKDFSLMVADAAAVKVIAQAEGEE